ncbi:MAG TPA: class I adenylate-forming enzyme family protein [Candidatus Methylomirabilis sp.]|nr:class I adenylate-forming enzyme family protein [Candidatus Methylomirabilis sp.]
MNLTDFLASSAARYGIRDAVTDVRSGRVLTYRQLADEAERVAKFLIAQGVQPGQRIGLIAPNGLAYLPAAFGLLATGACMIPLPGGITPTEITRIMTEIQVNGCLAWPAPNAVLTSPPATITAGGVCDGFTFGWVDRSAEGPRELARLNPAFIRFTSGTTASSKGVVLSHEATAARVEAADSVLRFTEEDRILWVLPLAYHFAVTIVAYVRAGANVLMCPDTLPGALVEAVERFRPSVLYASPLHFERMSNLTPRGPFESVRLCLSTSAPITAAVIDRFESRYGVPVGQAYGIIEAGLPCINLRGAGLSVTSVGRPVPGYEVAIFSGEGTRPAGTPGEVAVRGRGLFSAYYAPWRLSEQITRDGWFLTGDIGYLDESGALYLQGRRTAVIFVAGLKFFPEEVEQCIDQFPGIRESRVFGRAHARLGDVPCAEIVVDAGGCDLDGLKAHCARLLSPYKVPVEWSVVEAVPRTPGGKILRRPIREVV